MLEMKYRNYMSSKAIPIYLFPEAGKTQFIQEIISDKRKKLRIAELFSIFK